MDSPTSLQILRATRSLSPSDDLDVDAVALQGLDRRRGRLLRRVEEGSIAVQDQVALIGLGVGSGVARNDSTRNNVFAGNRQHAEAIGRELLVLLLKPVDVGVIHGVELAVKFEVRAAREDRLRGSFADDAVLAFGRTDNDRHDAALEVEGDFIHLCIFGDLCVSVGLGMREHRAVQDVLQARLEVTIHVRQRENAFVFLQRHVAVLLQDDADPSSACRSCRCRARPSRPDSGWH